MHSVTITNSLGRELKGVLHACDNGELVLDAKESGYHIMPTSRITAMVSHGLEGQKAQQAEKPKPKKEEVPRPKGVSDIGWGVFVALKKTYVPGVVAFGLFSVNHTCGEIMLTLTL